jgi:hypothetical protein
MPVLTGGAAEVTNQPGAIGVSGNNIQGQKFTAVTDTSTGAGTYVVAPQPAFIAYTAGQTLQVTFNSTALNTGASTINVSGLGAKNIFRNGIALKAADIVSSGIYTLVFDGTQFNIVGAQSYVDPQDVIANRFTFFVDSSSGANAYAITPVPAIAALVAGQQFSVQINGTGTNTGASTLAVSGLTATAIQRNGAALIAGELLANQVYDILFDGTVYEIVGSSTYVIPGDTPSFKGISFSIQAAPAAAPALYFFDTGVMSAATVNGMHVTPIVLWAGVAGKIPILICGVYNQQFAATFVTSSVLTIIGATSTIIMSGTIPNIVQAASVVEQFLAIASSATLTLGEGAKLTASATTTGGSGNTLRVCGWYALV